ncbi:MULTISPECIES: DUF5668 domain-containing protein [Bacillaceae]|uniref:LiaI-LiaF-like domain-containing protein n=1 Tax=Bacillaceae TaxID=186817 RepID=UPI001BDEB778|nr:MULTISPECIES: DUF5668 domain-containing protein [Bacillaceae]MDX8359399.1 hypothetical protein [Cytobacillus sp. IB215316]
MKKQSIFSSIILIGFGIYLLIQQLNIKITPGFYTWPTWLLIIGTALLAHAYITKQYNNILPGIILFGFGIHFQNFFSLPFWPDNPVMLLFIISIGLLLQYTKLKTGLIQGLLLLFIALLFLFNNEIMNWIGNLENTTSSISSFWPFILIAIGLYILFFQKG